MPYDKITNPITNRQNKITSSTGKKVLHNYIKNYNNHYGGAKCTSKNKEPKACRDKKMFHRQSLIFHPDYNQGCIEEATAKFQRFITLPGCVQGAYDDPNVDPQPNPDTTQCMSKLQDFWVGVTKCVELLGFTLEYLDENGFVITWDEAGSPKKLPFRRHKPSTLDLKKANDIKANLMQIYNDCKGILKEELVLEMKYQINEYLNPLFIKASTDFMTEREKAKQQERQRETESEKAEQRERQRARVEWDDSCGRYSAFKKQWDSEIFNINRALDTQPHTSTTSSDLSRRILKIRASYTACKSMKGALQKKAEIAELREQLNELIQKYDKFNGQQQTSEDKSSTKYKATCGEGADWRRNWSDNIFSIQNILSSTYNQKKSLKAKKIISKLNDSFKECKKYHFPNRPAWEPRYKYQLDTINTNYGIWE